MKILSLLLAVLFFSACKDTEKPAEQAPAAEQKTEKGKCLKNTDCPAGQECVDGKCMTNAVPEVQKVPEARGILNDYTGVQKKDEEQRDRAIDNALKESYK
jgi:PBP1b-binding outer membrane lipoprotein LpoB